MVHTVPTGGRGSGPARAPWAVLLAAAVVWWPGSAWAQSLPPVVQQTGEPAENAFEHLARRIADGDAIQVVFLGGSNTIGNSTQPAVGVDAEHGPYDVSWYDESLGFRDRIVDRLNREVAVVPDQFQALNAALGGTSTALASWRIRRDVLARVPAPDLVFIEFVTNDFDMLALAPEEDRSIARSLLGIVEQLCAANERVAIVSLLTTVRGGLMDPTSDLQVETAAARKEHLRFVADRVRNLGRSDMAVYDATRHLYAAPIPRHIAGPPFLGAGDPSEQKHPSPYGHQLIAEGVVTTLTTLLEGGRIELPDFERYRTRLRPFPRAPRILSAEEVFATATNRVGFGLRPAQDTTPIFEGTKVLYATAAGAELEFEFLGEGAFDLWVQKRYDGLRLNARIELSVDGLPYHLLTEPVEPSADGRLLRHAEGFSDLPYGLHSVKLRVVDPPQNGLPMRVAFHGFLIDEGG